ncbi:MAG TPA: hypothetical protein VI981_03005 [Candidatus Paceibacterota bacterium]|nr:MAG: hypothetical protein UX72_C0034G0006 [Parcubacteria group bacterium GW2011_GWA2_47_10]
MTYDKQNLDELIEKLLKFGEDAEELGYWQSIFDDLEPGEQEALISNLRDELEKLEKLK